MKKKFIWIFVALGIANAQSVSMPADTAIVTFHSTQIKNKKIDRFDLIIDLQSKLRNSLILKMIPHKIFISSCLNFMLSKPKLNLVKEKTDCSSSTSTSKTMLFLLPDKTTLLSSILEIT